jgi:outer membrane receptor protein involved in Fe transport
MAKSRSLQQAVRFALATAASGVSALHAQEAPAPAPAAAPVEEVVVTGSRLSTPNETSISPITTVSAVDLQQTGLTRVEDVLNNLPQVFAGMNSTTSNGADGTATVDLRGLGNQRTLVLVDGLRLGPGSALGGRNYSDINQIPAALIERVDVLTGGASAVYGADAVAGVVNFILNTHFEGIKIDAGYHFNQHDNDNQDGINALLSQSGNPVPSGNVNTAFGKNASILMGSNFADNKGNATAYVTYDNQGAALQSKFDYGGCSLGPTGAPPPNGLACEDFQGRQVLRLDPGRRELHPPHSHAQRVVPEHRYPWECRQLQLRSAELLPGTERALDGRLVRELRRQFARERVHELHVHKELFGGADCRKR